MLKISDWLKGEKILFRTFSCLCSIFWYVIQFNMCVLCTYKWYSSTVQHVMAPLEHPVTLSHSTIKHETIIHWNGKVFVLVVLRWFINEKAWYCTTYRCMTRLQVQTLVHVVQYRAFSLINHLNLTACLSSVRGTRTYSSTFTKIYLTSDIHTIYLDYAIHLHMYMLQRGES